MTQSEGHIHVQSELRKGSSFQIYLPFVDLKVDHAPSDEPIERGQGEIILVVEDEPPLREIASMLIENLGYQAVVADGPEDAIAKIELEKTRPRPAHYRCHYASYQRTDLGGTDSSYPT